MNECDPESFIKDPSFKTMFEGLGYVTNIKFAPMEKLFGGKIIIVSSNSLPKIASFSSRVLTLN